MTAREHMASAMDALAQLQAISPEAARLVATARISLRCARIAEAQEAARRRGEVLAEAQQ